MCCTVKMPDALGSNMNGLEIREMNMFEINC